MNAFRFSSLLSLLPVVCPLVLSAQSPGTRLRALLPRGRITVEVLEMWSPPRMVLLTQRLQQAIQADPSWWQEHVRRGVPGEPLAYDARLGLTEPEYREYLALTDSMRMKPARTTDVIIEPSQSGWRFGAASSIPGLRGVEIDTIANVVHSPFGDLATADPIIARSTQRATGPWGGPRWNLDAVDTTTLSGAVAQFAIGKHAETGRTIIYYDAKKMEKGQLSARESLFLRVLQ